MFDTAEAYAKGKSEEEMWVRLPSFNSLNAHLGLVYRNLGAYRGRVIKELGIRRTDLVITTKLFWGLRSGPNDGGLSRKQYVIFVLFEYPCRIDYHESIIEGTQEALKRLQMDYVDVIFAHRPDKTG